MRDLNSKMYDAQRRHTVIMRKVPYGSLGLLKTNRLLVYVITALMLVIAILGIIMLFPANSLINDFQKRQMSTEIHKIEMNPVLSAEIKALKSQLIGLISGSIESKLRTLEASIHSGTINNIGIGAIQDIKNDVKVLKTYSETGAGRLIVEKYANPGKSAAVVNKQLMDEVSQLKNLIYISIASCGLMLAAVGGIWFQSRYRLGNDQNVEKKNHQLAGKE